MFNHLEMCHRAAIIQSHHAQRRRSLAVVNDHFQRAGGGAVFHLLCFCTQNQEGWNGDERRCPHTHWEDLLPTKASCALPHMRKARLWYIHQEPDERVFRRRRGKTSVGAGCIHHMRRLQDRTGFISLNWIKQLGKSTTRANPVPGLEPEGLEGLTNDEEPTSSLIAMS